MAQVFQFVDWLSMEALRLLVNKLTVAGYFNHDWTSDFEKDFAIGESVRVPLPNRGFIRNGLGYNPNTINRLYTTVNCNQVFGYDFEWDSVQAALEVERGRDRFRDLYIEPAMAQIAQEIDSRAANWAYKNANNIVGVLGTDPTSLATINQARQRMLELACPPGGERVFAIPPQVNTSLVPAQQGFFNPASDVARTYKTGALGEYAGFDFYESMSLYTHTAGTWAGAVTVTTTSVSGASTLAVTCTSGDTFKTGDVFAVANVNAVNPMTRRVTTTATQKTFVIPTDAFGNDQSITASGTSVTVPISPTIYGPDSPYQNVDRFPTAGDALTLFPGTSSPNGKSGKQAIAMSKDAFGIVGVKLEIPEACEMSSQQKDPDTGIYVAFLRMMDPQQRKMINRFDVCLGFGNLYSDSCCVRLLCA